MTSGLCDVLCEDPVVLDSDPDAVRAEFDALIAANFGPEPPDTAPDDASAQDRRGFERAPSRRRTLLPAAAVRWVPQRGARERGPPEGPEA